MRHQADEQVVVRRGRPGRVGPALLDFAQFADGLGEGPLQGIVAAAIEYDKNIVVQRFTGSL